MERGCGDLILDGIQRGRQQRQSGNADQNLQDALPDTLHLRGLLCDQKVNSHVAVLFRCIADGEKTDPDQHQVCNLFHPFDGLIEQVAHDDAIKDDKEHHTDHDSPDDRLQRGDLIVDLP